MTMLKDKIFKYRYSQLDEALPSEFFTQALCNSKNLCIGLGYFSSASFNVLADGMASFISNGGQMSLYINQYITQSDYNLLKSNQAIDFDSRILKSYIKLKATFSVRDEHFFKCLSYLIQNNRIEVKIIILENGGLPHEKYGVFTDNNGDKLYFVGSMNLTGSAIIGNSETIECVCSWTNKENEDRVKTFERHFINIWDGKIDGIRIYSAQKFCSQIMTEYPNVDKDELLSKEEEFIQNMIPKSKNLPKNLLKDIPHFPSKFPDGPMAYQEDAYKEWLKHEKSGIFAMATGTGKTVTSLNCALHEYEKTNQYNILILVPTLDLIEQWKGEVKSFGFKKIILISSLNPSWRTEIATLSSKLRHGRRTDFVIISTYDSFVNYDFQTILPTLSKDTILIADEAHNIGSQSVRKCFKVLQINKRIALSATPKRIYDEEGTQEIETFFNDQYPYTYSFPMSRAIKERRLTPYFYYPKIAFLNDEEMKEYSEFTRQLLKLFDSTTKTFRDPEKATKILMARKRIIHKADDKLRVYENILEEIGSENLTYTFVYAPQGKYEGSANDYAEDETSFLQVLLETTKAKFPKIKCNTFTSKDDKETRKDLLSAFAAGDLDVLIAMKCLDEGVDVPKAKYGIFTSSTGNPREFIQRRGRLLRRTEGKNYAYIYDIVVLPTPSEYDSTQMESNLLKSELKRVAYFANLSMNNFGEGGAMTELQGIANRYNLSLAQLINEIEQ